MDHDTLRTTLADRAPRLLPADRAMEILAGVSDALFPMHAAGRAYGPLAPDNIRTSPVRLVDLPVRESAYVAPELAAGGAPTPASDAYSFAILAHVLLTGAAPSFDLSGRPVAGLDLPAFAGEAIARALHTDPAIRPLPKVLHTLLAVVPLDRWPASVSDAAVQVDPPLHEHVEPVGDPRIEARLDALFGPAPVEPEPAPPTAGGSSAPDTVETPIVVVPDPEPEPVPDPEPASEEPLLPEPAEVAQPSPDLGDLDDLDDLGEGWHSLTAREHDVPAIDWSADDEPDAPVDALTEPAPAKHAAPGVDPALRAFVDSLRTDQDVPEIEPLEETLPEIEHGERRRRHGWGLRRHATRTSEQTAEQPDVEVDDADFHALAMADPGTPLADEPASDAVEDEVAPEPDVPQEDPAIATLRADHEAWDDEEGHGRSGRISNDRLQRIVLGLLVVVLLLAALVWALTHKDDPKPDPQLQGASLTVPHASPLRS